MDKWWLTVSLGVDGPNLFSLPFPEATLSIGRGEECDLVLPNRRLSRVHLLLERKGKKASFRDAGSSTGLILEGKRVTEGELKVGQKLYLSKYAISFDCQAAKSEGNKTPETFDDGDNKDGGPTLDWQVFHSFLDKLRKLSEPKELLNSLLLGLVDIFKAERGFVLLRSKNNTLLPVATHRLSNAEKFVAISKTVYTRALESGNIVFVGNTLTDEWYIEASSYSLQDAARSIVCAPLSADGKTFGTIYIDSKNMLSTEQLPLFETVTDLAAEILRTGQTRKKLLAAEERVEAMQSLMYEDEKFVLGNSEASRQLKATLDMTAKEDVAILITGDTGTGKEMVARAIHQMSERRDQPFIPVNCAALPREIIEAELFGAEKGAYTGALARRVGRFELAANGTLFLDEIGELSPDVQVKLLRVLQEKKITRLGSTNPIPLDFRLLCATNRNLDEAVREGSFRQDFYYRINVFSIHLKALRERKEDIPELAEHFFKLFCLRLGKKLSKISDAAVEALLAHDWPGNIRELRNAIERAVVLEQSDVLRVDNLPMTIQQPTNNPIVESPQWLPTAMPPRYDDAKAAFDRLFIEQGLEQFGGVAELAKSSGITRSTIYRKMAKLGMDPEEY